MKCFVRLSFLCLLFVLPQVSVAMSRRILLNAIYRSTVEGVELYHNTFVTDIVCQRVRATGEISCFKVLANGEQEPVSNKYYKEHVRDWILSGQPEVALNEAPAEQIESSEIKKV